MKHSLKILISSLAVASLTACGGGGGGSSDPGPATAGIAGVNGTQGYLGKGDWSGNLIGQNVASQQYQMFMYQYGGGNQQFTTLIGMRVWSGRTGVLPEQMGFQINGGRYMGGDGFINGNGFLINNYNYGGYGYGYGRGYPGQGQCFPYPCQPQAVNPIATGTPVIQITTQFIDVCRSQMSVEVRYQGVVVLSGPMNGTVQFNQPYGYGGGYPGYPGYAGGIPGQAAIPAQCYMNQQQPYSQQYP